MRKLFVIVGVIALLVTARTASAATITFNSCGQVASLCNHLQLEATLNGDAIDVLVTAVGGDFGIFGDSGNNHAFGLNVNGEGVLITKVNSGFTYIGSGDKMAGGLGNYEFIVNGPHEGTNATLPLSFTVTRVGGFQSDLDLFQLNEDGYYAAAHLRDNSEGGESGFVAASGPPVPGAQVPEPTTMVLLGSGLLVVFRARKAARKA